MTIQTKPVVGTELYHRYPRETEPQGVFVELDARTGHLTASFDPEVGSGTPTDVWNGHVVRWTIPPLRADAANRLLAEVAPLAERVVAGYSVRWDGNNHVAKFTKDAATAIDEIERLCDGVQGAGGEVVVWDGAEFFGALGSYRVQAAELGVVATTTDEELRALAERERANATNNGIDGVEGVVEHLEKLRAACQDAQVAAAA